MNEFIKNLIDNAKAEGAEIHVVQIGDEPKKDVESDFIAKAKNEAAEIAQLNRILYEAHIEAGFTKNEALALTRTTITN